MKSIVVLFPLALLASLSLASAAGDKFIVHEWGVQVVASAHGDQILTAPEELLAGLPNFVGRNTTPLRFRAHGWDKPVIHMYGKEGMEVSVKVETPTGVPLAYYPHPKVKKGTMWGSSSKRMMAGVFHFQAGVEWKGSLRNDAPGNLPEAPASHWWHDARAIPSSYFKSNFGSERFLFYEATAEQKPVIKAQLFSVAVELQNSLPRPVGPVVILLNDGTGVRGVERKEISAGKPTLVAKAEFTKWSQRKTLRVCRRQWRALGMTEEEAAGIVKVWKNDLVNRLGVLVISPMPQGIYDTMFPLTITPKPDELVRAGLVFDTLPGQESRRQWLPGLQAELRRIGGRLASEEFAERRAAQFAFRSAGDLGAGVLAELAKSDDPEVRRRAMQLQKKTGPQEVGFEFLRPKSKEHAARLVEHFWPPRKREREGGPGLPIK